MKRLRLPFVISIVLLVQTAFGQSSEVIKQYIATYKDAAIAEMQRSGVPASITLAQGIHETQAGTSDLVVASNNHFGIKCKSDWKGEYVLHDDDARGEHFRKYSCSVDSYKDHSDFLRNSSRYASLFQLDPTDYQSWAWGLKKAGYATNPKYPQILIKLIEDYHLQDYTLIAMLRKNPSDAYYADDGNHPANDAVAASGPAVNTVVKESTYPEGVFKINDTRVVFVSKGTSYLAIAQQYELSLSRLFEFNDMQPQDVAATDGLLFIQRKRRTGTNETHKVITGENLYNIAQTEGIRMENLLAYNFLKENMQPQTGEILYLQNQAPAMPKLASATKVNDNAITAQVQQTSAHAAKSDFVKHIVQPKETIYSITKKYEVTADEVMNWNDMQTPDLKVGQELRINKKSLNATN